jgi:hypothetical protein
VDWPANCLVRGGGIAYGATTKINRKNFGLSLNAILDGRLVVSEEIQIMIEGERSSSRRRRRPPLPDGRDHPLAGAL